MKIKEKLLLLLIMLFNVINLTSQNAESRFRLRAKIIDIRTEKVLSNFPVRIIGYNRTVNTNEHGEILFNMPRGVYTLVLDDYPYIKKEIEVALYADTSFLFKLETPDKVLALREVEVVASSNFTQRPANEVFISERQSASLPAMIGERDILRSLSLSAGINPSSEGAADIQVRGSQHGHNLFLLDNIPLYSTQHMFGMVSVFNPSIIQSATIYKAGFPARYGGRIGSVINVQTKEPDLHTKGGDTEIGLLSSKLTYNLPVIRGKAGISFSGRISNYSLISLLSLFDEINNGKIGMHFADINSSFRYVIDNKHSVKISCFLNSDGYTNNETESGRISEFTQENKQQNINVNLTSNWSDKLLNKLQLYYDLYNFGYLKHFRFSNNAENQLFNIQSNIGSVGFDDNLSMRFSNKLLAETGLSFRSYSFTPYNLSINDSLINSTVNQDSRFVEGSTYFQANYKNENLVVDAGVRLTSYGNKDKMYGSLEPRLVVHQKFNEQFSVSASFSKMTQHIHRVANPGLGITLEQFYPSDIKLLPQTSRIYSLGSALDLPSHRHSISFKADVWFKNMTNLVEFRDGFDAITMILASNYITNNKPEYLTQGKGWATGIDISANLRISNLQLTTNYTLMEARSKFNELNNGRWFASSTDIRHALSTVAEIKLNNKWSVTASWQYRSGRPFTLPTAVYPTIEPDFRYSAFFYPNNVHGERFSIIETERNNARMKPFHRADISFNHQYLLKNKYIATISFGIFNIYNRANPSYYFISHEKKDETYYPVLKSFSMFPILPSFSWGVKF